MTQSLKKIPIAASTSSRLLRVVAGEDLANSQVGRPSALDPEVWSHRTRRCRPIRERILSTVLVTDIIGSTETTARVGDARWSELLVRHNTAAKRAVDRYRGRLIDSAGDGLLAIFDGPSRAVRCAQAIGSALRPMGLKIRAGCHTSEIEMLDNGVCGIGVHIAARIAALAATSEVLVSSVLRDLVTGSGLRFEYRGQCVLRGVPDRWHLYAVLGESRMPRCRSKRV